MLKFILFMFISIFMFLLFVFIYVEITLLVYFLKLCEEWHVRY